MLSDLLGDHLTESMASCFPTPLSHGMATHAGRFQSPAFLLPHVSTEGLSPSSFLSRKRRISTVKVRAWATRTSALRMRRQVLLSRRCFLVSDRCRVLQAHDVLQLLVAVQLGCTATCERVGHADSPFAAACDSIHYPRSSSTLRQFSRQI